MNIISKKQYILMIVVAFFPVTIYFVWMLVLAIIYEEAYNILNQTILIQYLAIPGASTVIWMGFWSVLWYKPIRKYEKNQKAIKLNDKHYSEYEANINIEDIKKRFEEKEYVVIHNTYYMQETINGEDITTYKSYFVRFENCDYNPAKTFFDVVGKKELFPNAYKQDIKNSINKYLFIITDEFDYSDQKTIKMKCIDWKIEAMTFSRRMPNEFWAPIIYINETNTIYFLDFMCRKREIQSLLFNIRLRKKV